MSKQLQCLSDKNCEKPLTDAKRAYTRLQTLCLHKPAFATALHWAQLSP